MLFGTTAKQWMGTLLSVGLLAMQSAMALDTDTQDEIEVLNLDVISYEDFINEDPTALQTLENALHEKGIVGIKGVPGFGQAIAEFLQGARSFCALPEEVKERYAPNHELGEMFLGYEMGKEKFRRPDGRWVVDDLKVSYYGYVPEHPENKWPLEVDLQTPFQNVGSLMSAMGKSIMYKIGLLGEKTGIELGDVPQVGRMLYYKGTDSANDNPYWCGAHYDHGMFTVLLPAFYYVDGDGMPEPFGAGLYVKTPADGLFKKVVFDDQDVMLFQVGEFGQLATDDAIRATEHRVQKAPGYVERFTMALFFDAPMGTEIHSHSELTQDARYGGNAGDPCTYQHWHEESFNRYIVIEDVSQ